MSVSEPFVSDDLAGQIAYLIDNQDAYLVDDVTRISDTELTLRLWTGERFALAVRPLPAGPLRDNPEPAPPCQSTGWSTGCPVAPACLMGRGRSARGRRNAMAAAGRILRAPVTATGRPPDGRSPPAGPGRRPGGAIGGEGGACDLRPAGPGAGFRAAGVSPVNSRPILPRANGGSARKIWRANGADNLGYWRPDLRSRA